MNGSQVFDCDDSDCLPRVMKETGRLRFLHLSVFQEVHGKMALKETLILVQTFLKSMHTGFPSRKLMENADYEKLCID